MKIDFFTRTVAGGAALVSSALGLFTLGAWTLGRWNIVTLGADYIPMAPITALLFAVLGLALGARLLWSGVRAAEFAIMTGAALTALTCAMELARLAGRIPLPWDSWGFGVEMGFGVMEIGRMAPLTAATFLLATLALAAQGPWLCRVKAVRWTGTVAASVGSLIGGVAALGYAAGTPLGYQPENVPMALLTALAFLALHAGLLLADKGGEWVRAWSVDDEEPTDPGQDGGFTRRMILALAATLITGALGGFFYLRSEKATIRDAVHEQMLAVAELKVSQIAAWRAERLADARSIAAVPGLAEMIEDRSAAPGSESVQWRELGIFLQKLGDTYDYRQIVLFDQTMTPAGRFPADVDFDHPVGQTTRQEIAAAKDVLVKDFHLGRAGRIHMSLLAPLRTQGDRGFAGAVLFIIDADTHLFPLVRKWPTPSASGETVLIRREGAEVVFLNELRHAHDGALRTRASLDAPTLLAARALRGGMPGLLEGTDYRGVPVLGVARQVPDSPWTLIAKIDQAEANAPIRERILSVFIILGLMLAIGALLVRSSWQRRRRKFIHRQLATERLTHAVSERLALVMRHANDVILLFDSALRIVESNDRALAVYGRTPEEMRRLTVRDLREEESVGSVQRDFAAALGDGITFETIHRRKDGSTFPVEVSARPVEIEGRPHVLSIIRDITQRKRHEAEIKRLNRMYWVISQVNQALVRAKTRPELFAEVCRVMIEVGRFRLAWIGWLNPETQIIEPVAVAGDEHGYVPSLRISADATAPEGSGPAGVAFREGRTYVCNDFLTDPTTEPWRERAVRSGMRSVIALPLQCEGRMRGLLTVYSEETGFYAPQEVRLLEEAAGDVSFALDVFAAGDRHRAAELALGESEERFRVLFQDISSVAVQGYAADGVVQFWNHASELFYGYTAQEAMGRNLLDLIIPPEARAGVTKAIRELVETGTLIPPGEISLMRKDGSRVDVYSSYAVVRLPGRPLEFFCMDVDLTDRNRAVEALRASEQEFRSLAESLPQIVWATRADGWNIYFNQRWMEYTGLSLEESYGHGWNVPFHPEDRQRAWDAWQQATHNNDPYVIECRLRRADGVYRWWLIRGVPLCNASGEILKWFGTCTDIETLKRAEEALRQQADELRDRNDTLTRFNQVAVGRELRMIELKLEVNALCVKLGESPRHRIVGNPPPAPSIEREPEPS